MIAGDGRPSTLRARLTAATVVCALLAGCGTPLGGGERGAESETIPAPRLEPGQSFLYSDGRLEKVVAVGVGEVSWITGKKFRYTGHAAFFLPRISWESRTRKATLVSDVDLEDHWPLRVGATSWFGERTVITDKKTGNRRLSARRWRCAVEGTERVTVLAGAFDTARVTCQRVDRRGKIRERRQWHYAPSIGHVVRYESELASGKVKKRELVAARPPKSRLSQAARRRLDTDLQTALEHGRAGDVTATKVANLTRAVEPMRTFRLDDGTYCRQYRETLKHGPESRTYGGIACRNRAGVWRVPKS